MTARLYIDGYNFYYAIKNSRSLPIYLAWCDFRKLAEQHLLPKGCDLGWIKYFTAPVGRFGIHGEETRQNEWLRAVGTIPNLKSIHGFHQRHGDKARQEKQTDVNIAVEMIIDTIRDDSFDRAVLIGADVDLLPAAKAIASDVPKPRHVDVWFPPGRKSRRWLDHQGDLIRCNEITPDMLEGSRLPEEIHHEGRIIRCLPEWRKPNY